MYKTFLILMLFIVNVVYSQNIKEQWDYKLVNKQDKERFDQLVKGAEFFMYTSPTYSVDYFKEASSLVKYINLSDSTRLSFTSLMAEIYLNNTDFEKALQLYRDLYIDAQIKGETVWEIQILVKLAEVLLNINESDEALEHLQKAEILAKDIRDDYLLANVLLKRSDVLIDVYEFKEGEKVAEVALSKFEAHEDQLGISEVLNNLGTVYRYFDNYDESVATYSRSMEIRRELNRPDLVASSCFNLGLVHSEYGRPELSVEYLKKALDIYQKYGFNLKIAKTNYAIGQTYWKHKKNETAIEYYRKSMNYYSQRQDYSEVSKAAKMIAHSYRLKQLDSALFYFDKAIFYAQKSGEYDKAIRLTSSKGQLYSRANDHYNTLKYRMAVIKMSEEYNNEKELAHGLFMLSITYTGLYQYSQAVKVLLQALEIAKRKDDTKLVLLVLKRLGKISIETEQYEKAIEYYENAIIIEKSLNTTVNLSVSFQKLGETYMKMGKYQLAYRNYKKSLSLREELNNQALIGVSYSKMGSYYMQRMQWDKAAENYNVALNHYSSKNRVHIIRANISLGIIHTKLNNYELAETHYFKALSLISENMKKTFKRDVFDGLFQLYEAQGYSKKAFEAFRTFSEYDREILRSIIKKYSVEENQITPFTLASISVNNLDDIDRDVVLNEKDKQINEIEKKLIQKGKSQIVLVVLTCFLLLSLLTIILLNRKRRKDLNDKIVLDSNIKYSETKKQLYEIQDKKELVLDFIEEVRLNLYKYIEEKSTSDENRGVRDLYIIKSLKLIECFNIWKGNSTDEIMKPVKIQPQSILQNVLKHYHSLIVEFEQVFVFKTENNSECYGYTNIIKPLFEYIVLYLISNSTSKIEVDYSETEFFIQLSLTSYINESEQEVNIPEKVVGLEICKDMIENVGGKIWYESKEHIKSFIVSVPWNSKA